MECVSDTYINVASVANAGDGDINCSGETSATTISGGGSIPIGSIVGVDTRAGLPNVSHWTLCDGNNMPADSAFNANNPSPNLTTNNFLKCTFTGIENSDSSNSVSMPSIPNHTHSYTANPNNLVVTLGGGQHNHTFGLKGDTDGGGYAVGRTSGNSFTYTMPSESGHTHAYTNHTHKLSLNLPNVGSSVPWDKRPQYLTTVFYVRHK